MLIYLFHLTDVDDYYLVAEGSFIIPVLSDLCVVF